MKIVFSPEFSGTVYIRTAQEGSVMMDTMVVNAMGLISFLELNLGLHYNDIPASERLARYFVATSTYMRENPENVMYPSFKTSGLGTTRMILKWRDELRLAGWDLQGEEISDRLATLIGIEGYFKGEDNIDIAYRIRLIRGSLMAGYLDCSDFSIEIPCELGLLQPMLRDLLESLKDAGAEIHMADHATESGNNLSIIRNMFESRIRDKITLEPTDNSIEIWEFEDDRQACEYLAYRDLNGVDVWINSNNKPMDSWMRLLDKPVSGSISENSMPHLTQLFVMGVGLFAEPLNVNTLIEWLNMPYHPIDRFFRSLLANAIVEQGGYRNEKCRSLIERYINGDFLYLTEEEKALPEDEQVKLHHKDRKKRSKLAGTFLPPLERREEVKTESIRVFVDQLASWSRQQAHLLSQTSGKEQIVEQLGAVASMCDAFRILLSAVEENIDYKTIDAWLGTVCKNGTYTNAVAERGCRTVIDSPAKIASVAGTVIWVGVDGDPSTPLECEFVAPSARIELAKQGHISFWSEAAQNHYHETLLTTPLRMTEDKLVLVVRKRVNGEPVVKHPLIVRLEQQIENLKDFIKKPYIGIEDRHEAEVIENGGVSAELQFDHADLLQWPDHLSPTTIENLVAYPFDYLMERLLGITNDGKTAMGDVKTTKGNVAHKVIECLFAPREGEKATSAETAVARIKEEFETVYTEVLEGQGAVLQLSENKLAEKLLHEQLRNCLDSLVDILKANMLKVTGCELRAEDKMGFGLPVAHDKDGNVKERDILGFIDMTLEDENGRPVIIDFKWTTWTKGYREKLEGNRSVQLELYRWMLTRQAHNAVERVAYFLMPEGRLYSLGKFAGRNSTRLTPANNDNIVDQLRRSAIYRINQRKNGIVETYGLFEELQYVKDTETQSLYPLIMDEELGTKKDNFFSNYGLFNC